MTRDDVLFAIRNGGFSGAIMPANIVIGQDAEAVADFVAEYSGESGTNDPTASGQTGGSRGVAMLDLRQIREDPSPRARRWRAAARTRPLLDEALELDERRRALLPELEELRARKNEA